MGWVIELESLLFTDLYLFDVYSSMIPYSEWLPRTPILSDMVHLYANPFQNTAYRASKPELKHCKNDWVYPVLPLDAEYNLIGIKSVAKWTLD